MKRARMAVAAMVVWGLVGCAAPRGAGPLIDPLEAGKIGYSLRWATDLYLPAGHSLTWLGVRNGALLTVESPANFVTAVSLRDGSVLWRRVVGDPHERLMGVIPRGNTVLVNSESRLYVLEEETGKLLAASTLEQAVASPPVLEDEYAIFGGVNGKVFAHDLSRGFSKWGYQLTDMIRFQPELLLRSVFVADRQGVIAALASDSGDLLWRRRPADGIAGQMVVTPLALLVPTTENKLHAVNRVTGRDRWVYRAEVGMLRGPVVLGNTIFQKLNGRQWAAIDSSDGRELWRVQGEFHCVVRVQAGVIFSGDGRLVLVEPDSGRMILTLPTRPLQRLLMGPDESLLLICPTGRILRLDATP